MKHWMNCEQVAQLSGVSEQRIRSVCLQISKGIGREWRGASLVVREIHGRGGRSGTSYQVLADSLPADLQERLKALRNPVERRLNHGQKAQIERDWFYSVLHPAIIQPKGSRERAAAVRDIAAKRHMRPDGTWRTFSERSIQRYLDDYETKGGLAALGRSKRSDAGSSRVFVTREWDAAVPFDEATKEGIAHDLRQYIRGLIHAGESASGILVLAPQKLANLTVSAGFSPDRAERERICHIPKGHVQREAQHRKVRRFENDRKAHEDAKPRIRRTRAGLLPMDVIVGDVHPIDVLVCREDGSTIRTRAISWLDLATNRVRLDPVLLEKGEGIRNADVIASFARMVAEWGAPRKLYLDNGSEYNWAEFIDDALKLIDREGCPTIGAVEPWSERASNVVRAKPYNASAKPIEGLFSVLETTVFATIPGWVGGDPMNQKKARVGRPAAPFPGTFEDFCAAIAAAVAFYEVKPQRGSLAGKPPRTAWNEAVAAGWGATAVDPRALLVAFSDAKPKTVSQGTISHKGVRYTCRELQAHQGDKVTALFPKYGEWRAIPIRDEHGVILGFAEPDRPFGFLDPEGAKEAEARSATHRRAVQALRRSVPPIDPNAERAAFLADLPALPPPPVAAVIGLTDETAAIAARIAETPGQRADRERREEEARQDQIDREAQERNELVKRLANARARR